MIAAKFLSDSACDAPLPSQIVSIPTGRDYITVGVTSDGLYIRKVQIGGAWVYVDALSSQFAAELQRFYDEMEPNA